jgi:hypothetical protein
MDEQSPGTAIATKQDLRDLKVALRDELGMKVDALNWKIGAVAALNLGGVLTGLAALFRPGVASSAAHAINAVGKAVGF